MFPKFIRKTEFLLLLIFCLGLIIRFPFLVDKSDQWYQVQEKPYSDARQNDIFARNWLLGKGYGDYIYGFKYQAYRVPFYPFFLAFIYFLFGHNYLAVKIIQSILGASTCIIIFYINRATFNKWVGLISALLWSLHFHFIIYTPALLAETLFVFSFSIAILFTIQSIQQSSYKKLIAAGIFIAISALTRSVGIILLPAAIFWIFIAAKLPWKKAVSYVMILCLATLVILSPWFFRNYHLIGHPFLLSSIGALQLWNASNPEYYSFDERKAWYEIHWSHPYATEGERYQIASKDVIRFIKSDVKGYMKSCYRRAYIFYKPPRFPRVNLAQKRLFALNRYSLTNISIIFTLILAPIGFILLLPQLRRMSLHLIIIFGYSSFYFLSGAMGRYRMPLEFILVSFAAAFIYLIFNIHKIKNWNKIFDNQPASKPLNQKKKKPTLYLCRTLSLILAALIIFFIGKVSFTYLNPEGAGNYFRISQSRINRILQNEKLLSQWSSQGKRSITYDDLFQEQAKNFGHFPQYRSHIVVWQGEINYCLRDSKGNITSFALRINPSPYHFGEGVIYCFANERRINKMKIQHIDDGDIIAVFGHLEEHIERSFSFPSIIFFHLEKLR